MNNSMVAHLWANEKKESARGSNFFFEGRSIYSYGYHFEVGRIVRNKCGEKAYLLNDKYYSSSTCKHQHCVRSAIPTGSKVFYVGYNMSDDGSMAFITSQLELIKEVIEKYKKVRTSLSYRDVWGVFRSLMDYIEFFNMGTPKSLLKKSANTWIGTKHELSYGSDKDGKVICDLAEPDYINLASGGVINEDNMVDDDMINHVLEFKVKIIILNEESYGSYNNRNWIGVDIIR